MTPCPARLTSRSSSRRSQPACPCDERAWDEQAASRKGALACPPPQLAMLLRHRPVHRQLLLFLSCRFMGLPLSARGLSMCFLHHLRHLVSLCRRLFHNPRALCATTELLRRSLLS